MKKLITLPDEVSDILNNYKEKTGMSATSYIQRAVYKSLIHDKLMIIKPRIIYYEKEDENNGNKLNETVEVVPEKIQPMKGC